MFEAYFMELPTREIFGTHSVETNIVDRRDVYGFDSVIAPRSRPRRLGVIHGRPDDLIRALEGEINLTIPTGPNRGDRERDRRQFVITNRVNRPG